MIKYIIWIDLKKAVLGTFNLEDQYKNWTIQSGIDNRVRFPGEISNKIRMTTSKRTKETSEKRKLERQVVDFCKKIIHQIINPEMILIIGPSGAKLMLKKAIINDPTLSKIPLSMKNSDQLTLAQIKDSAARFYKIKLRKPASRRMT